MSLKEIFSAHLMDHYRYPRHFGDLDDSAIKVDGVNPSCGDELVLQMKATGDKVEEVSFNAKACAICVASASMFCERAKGADFNELDSLKNDVYEMLHNPPPTEDKRKILGDIAALEGVSKLPSRVKCAALVWETWTEMRKRIENDQ